MKKKMTLAGMLALMLFGMATTTYADRDDWRGGIRERIHDTV